MSLFPVPDEPRDPKQDLHDAIQRAIATMAGLEGTAATRWVIVVETAMPNAQLGLLTITGNAALTDLRTWESTGLLTTALTRVLRQNLGGPAPPPPPF